MTPQEALEKISDGIDLSSQEMLDVMRQIMKGEVTSLMIAALISSLKTKRESVDEIAAAATVMRDFASSVKVGVNTNLLDTCGTGGDGSSTFNISTLSAFVAASAGVKVAKHGGRSVSSTCGSADILEALGANLKLGPDQVAHCVDRVGIGFMFAPNHHSAMRYAAPVRKELGMRTMFNILGPLTNPAHAKNQLLGVYRKDLVAVLARVLKELGSKRALVVHGSDGIDEISIAGPSYVAELSSGDIKEYTIDPEQFGLERGNMELLKADSVKASKDIFQSVVSGKGGVPTDIVSLNAGAGIYVSGLASSIGEGIKKAREVIETGLVRKKIDEFIRVTKQFSIPE